MLIQRATRLVDLIDRVVQVVGASLVGLMALVVLIQVVTRYLRIPLPWPEELARILLLWVTFLGAVLGARHGSHYVVRVVVDLLPRRVERVVRATMQILACVVLAVLAVEAARLAETTQAQITPALGLSNSVVYLVLPISAVLMLIQFAMDALLTIAGARERPDEGAVTL